MLYSLVGITAIIILLSINYNILFDRHYKPHNHKALRAYRFFIWSLALFFTVDALWGIFYEFESKIYVTIDTAFYFVIMAMLVFAWTRFLIRYIDENKKLLTVPIHTFGYVFLTAGVIVVIINFFQPILFSYETNVYVPNLGRYVFLLSQIGLFVVTSAYALIVYLRHNRTHREQYLTIASVGIVMSITTLLQLFRPDLPFYAVGCILGAVLIHLFVVIVEKNAHREEINDAMVREEQQRIEINETKLLAYTDSLTGKKNKHAYVEFEEGINKLIHENKADEFALFIFDLNDLKKINDTYGHEMGDKYIIKSCQLIEKFFPNLELYRFGGDEFVIIIQGEAYKNRYQYLKDFNAEIEKHLHDDEPIIAVGFSDFVFGKDNTLRAVFVRADERMYNRKRKLKEMSGELSNETDNKSENRSNNLRLDMYEMFYKHGPLSLIDLMNGSTTDEILEVDLKNDKFKQYFHVEGKYLTPNIEGSYKDLYDFTIKYVVHPDDRGIYEGLMKKEGFFERLQSARIPNFDFAHFRYKLIDGEYRYVEQVVITGEENGIPEGMFRLYVLDINNLKSRQLGKISDGEYQANIGRDSLTGLFVGKQFFNIAEEKLAEQKDKKWCFISLDIEHFKFFDEWFGREQGNLLLAKIGAELKACEELYGGIAGYFGSDDFSMVLPYDMKNIESIYESVKDIISSFGLTAGFLPAIGVSVIEKDMVLADALDRSSIAEKRAKENARYRICLYTSDMQFLAQQEYRILTDFIKALKDDEITFYLQPQVNITNGAIVGAEALARWFRKDGKIVPPAKFVAVLEKYGFITDLDKYIWEKVCKWLSEWTKNGHKAVPVSLNVSRIDIFNIDIAQYFHDLTAKYNLPHNLLKIEITESAYAESTSLIDDLVNKLREDGFVVLMDDFGSGYSSLNMLSNLKLDAIKLDTKFLNLETNLEGRGIHIIESIVNMAKTMALPIIVEGVETKEQYNFLLELGCHYVQGFYFFRPLPIEEFENIIKDETKIDEKGFVMYSNEQFRIREFLDENLYSDSMLNNILGPVAIYSWDKKENVDIVRYNQQFVDAVNVPDFNDRLVGIQQYLPAEDLPKLFIALKEAMNNRLNGATEILRFNSISGTILFFRIHFYHLGKKEGTERFYGSATNVTELEDFRIAKKHISDLSIDNLIFITRIYHEWHYSVISHGLSDVFNLSPIELENELNEGLFAKRVVDQKGFKKFMVDVEEYVKEKKNFTHDLEVYDKDHKKVNIHLQFTCVNDGASNIDYVLKTKIVNS